MADEPAAPDTGSGDQPDSQPEPATPSPPDTKPDTGEEKDWQAEAEKWQSQAKKHEREWKKFSKELDDLRQAQMSDQEKAVAEAEARGRTAALSESGKRLAAAEVKAALTGVVPDPTAIVEDLDLARYVTDDGDVDAGAVEKLKAKYEAMKPTGDPAPSRDPDFGARPPATPQMNTDQAFAAWLDQQRR